MTDAGIGIGGRVALPGERGVRGRCWVVAERAEEERFAEADAMGAFRLAVPPGRWVLTARSLGLEGTVSVEVADAAVDGVCIVLDRMSDWAAKARRRLGGLAPILRVGDPFPRWPGARDRSFWVVFRDKGKVKCGLMHDPFIVRYGIDVRATYGGGERWWFQSSGAVPDGMTARMRALFAGDAGVGVPVDLDALGWEP